MDTITENYLGNKFICKTKINTKDYSFTSQERTIYTCIKVQK